MRQSGQRGQLGQRRNGRRQGRIRRSCSIPGGRKGAGEQLNNLRRVIIRPPRRHRLAERRRDALHVDLVWRGKREQRGAQCWSGAVKRTCGGPLSLEYAARLEQRRSGTLGGRRRRGARQTRSFADENVLQRATLGRERDAECLFRRWGNGRSIVVLTTTNHRRTAPACILGRHEGRVRPKCLGELRRPFEREAISSSVQQLLERAPCGRRAVGEQPARDERVALKRNGIRRIRCQADALEHAERSEDVAKVRRYCEDISKLFLDIFEVAGELRHLGLPPARSLDKRRLARLSALDVFDLVAKLLELGVGGWQAELAAKASSTSTSRERAEERPDGTAEPGVLECVCLLWRNESHRQKVLVDRLEVG